MSQQGQFVQGSGPIVPVETLTGNTGGPVGPTSNNINVVGTGTVSVAGNPGTSTLTISVSGTVADSFPTDVGTAIPLAGVLNVNGGPTSPELISNINTYANPDTSNNLVVALNNTIQWPNTNSAGTTGIIYLGSNRFLSNYGTNNTFLGSTSGNTSLTVISAESNTGIGAAALLALTTGAGNSALGDSALSNASSGGSNTAIGFHSMDQLTTGLHNTAIGADTLDGSTYNGSGTIAIGYQSGDMYTSTESNNILVGNRGTIGDNGVTRIGTNAINTSCFITGIDGVNVGSVAKVITMASDQLGTATITAGTGVTVTPGANTITISATGTTTLAYTAVSTTPYVVLSTDDYLGVNSSGGAIQINLPNAPVTGRVYSIKDSTGSAATHNITVTTVGGVVNIDGATTFVMNTNFEAIDVIFSGSAWEVF